MTNPDYELDSILQAMGEIHADQADAPIHVFSHSYQAKKEVLLHTMKQPTRKKVSTKRIFALVAAALALATLSAFAYGFLFQPKGTQDPTTGDYSYENNIQSFSDVYACEANLTYIPSRYTENADGKYAYIAPDGTEYGISIGVETMYAPLFATHTSEAEKLNINGIPAELLTKNGSQYCNILNLFYHNSGHVVTIYTTADVTKQELLDMAEGVTLDIDYDTVWYTSEDYARDQEEVAADAPISPNTVTLGTQMILENNQVAYTVNEIHLLDTLPTDLDDTYFATRSSDSIAPYVDETGALKPFKRNLSAWDADTAQLVTTSKTVELQIVEAVLTVINLQDTAQTDVSMCPRLSYGDTGLWADSAVQADDLPFYFDQSDYVGTSHFYFMDMEPNETKQVHLLFAVAQDRVDNAYISFGIDGDVCYDVKIS